jgi:glyoxylase-like metal-dependent hydrolase (beta-lactamase superfamily II)
MIERSTHPQFVSNTYLVADGRGGPAFFIDAGGPVAPLIEIAQDAGLEPTHVLLTHHHFDHVSEVPQLRARWPELRVLASARERELLDAAAIPGIEQGGLELFEPGATLRFGELELRALATPGHTGGMLSFVLQGPGASADGGEQAPAVFTGDTLFKDSVGGVRAPGHSTYADLRESIMDKLMQLPHETVIHPGHAEQTSVAREWEHNPFIRIWRGLDAEGQESCTALGGPATLVLLATDYDGGKKAWVRWPDGSDDIVPGSQVQRL